MSLTKNRYKMNFPLLTQELEEEFLLRVSKVRLAMEKYRLDAV